MATYRRTLEHDIARWNAVDTNPASENAGKAITELIAWTGQRQGRTRLPGPAAGLRIITDSPEVLAKLLGRKI